MCRGRASRRGLGSPGTASRLYGDRHPSPGNHCRGHRWSRTSTLRAGRPLGVAGPSGGGGVEAKGTPLAVLGSIPMPATGPDRAAAEPHGPAARPVVPEVGRAPSRRGHGAVVGGAGKGPRERAAVLCLPPMLARAPAGRGACRAETLPLSSAAGAGLGGHTGEQKETGGKGKRKREDPSRTQTTGCRRPRPAHDSPQRSGEARRAGSARPRYGLPEGRAPRGRRPPARQQPPEEGGRGRRRVPPQDAAAGTAARTPEGPERRAAAPAARGAREAALASRSRPCRAGPAGRAARSQAALAGAPRRRGDVEGGSAQARQRPRPRPRVNPLRGPRGAGQGLGAWTPRPPRPARPCPVRWPRGRRGPSRWSSGPEATRHL